MTSLAEKNLALRQLVGEHRQTYQETHDNSRGQGYRTDPYGSAVRRTKEIAEGANGQEGAYDKALRLVPSDAPESAKFAAKAHAARVAAGEAAEEQIADLMKYDQFLSRDLLGQVHLQRVMRSQQYVRTVKEEGKEKRIELVWSYNWDEIDVGQFLKETVDIWYDGLLQMERQEQEKKRAAGASPEAQAVLAASRTGTPAAPTSPTPTPETHEPSKREMRARKRVLEALGVKDTSDLKSPTKLFEYLKGLGDEEVEFDTELDLPGVKTKDVLAYASLLAGGDRYSLSANHRQLYVKNKDGKVIGLLYDEGKGKVSAKVYSKPVESKELGRGFSVFRTKKLLEKLGDEDLEEGKDFYVRKGIFRDKVVSLSSKGRKVIEGIAESKNRNGVDYILVGGGGAVGATIALGAATIIAPPVGAAVIATSLLLGAVTGASGGKAVSCAEGIFPDGEKKKIKFGGVEVVTEEAEAPKKKKPRAAEVIVEPPASQAPAATPEDAAKADALLKELADLVNKKEGSGLADKGAEAQMPVGDTDPLAVLKKYSDGNVREKLGAAAEGAAGTEAKPTA